MQKYMVRGSYLQFFEVVVYADNEKQAEEVAYSGDADYMMGDCNDWDVYSVEKMEF